ncbi:fasciclin domain-containing protein [Aridibaculum aurantiacum]|uniref:fasciclin domain-containing protein n=1 Tax=Aridibaculum aurantiacum TaxID=2810307 RepID=UPI001A96CDBF|nr:fasciclin domain-containing protein [Aridibaculum aurantiacum]
MYNLTRIIFPLLLLAGLFGSCRKKAFDEYYGRPENLEPPVYQTLQAKGNFKHYLAAVDKAGYGNTLRAAGYWTVFAPHDSAFNAYFSTMGINGIEQLDSATCRQLVTYSLVYNAFKVERLDDYQSNTGWVPSSAWKRRTANYTYVYDGTDTAGRPIKVVAANRNGTVYVDADNNNKHIPYFINEFMQSKNLTAADYNYFFPNTPYTGFNVVDAVVTEKDIPAENGVIHVVNKVITVLPSIDQYLGSKPEYSLFKSIFDRFLVQYVLNQGVTQRYRATTGSSADVYTKFYTAPGGTLAYSLNNENFMNAVNEGQTESYTIFAPTNTALQQYINNVLLENYPPNSTLKDVDINIVYDFINAHLWQKAVWPSKFGSTFSFLNEPARFNPSNDVVDKKVLSNGIFYGTNKVQEANVFTSVYGRAYLDPKYSMMKKLIDFELRPAVSDISRYYTMFMISNDMWNAAGFFADPTVSNNSQEQWRFIPPAGSTLAASTGATTRNRMLRILNLHVVPHSLPNRVLNSLAGEGAVMTAGGEYIGFKNNTVFASGNVEENNVANIISTKTSRNGRVYYINRILDFSDVQIGAHIEKVGTPTTSEYNYFWQFLRTSSIWNATTKEITGISYGTFYTVLIPNNAAIMQAVRDTLLPGNRTTGVPNFNFGTQSNQEREQVIRFIYYHILDKRTVAADGEESGSFSTILRTNLGDPTNVFVNNNPGSLVLTDMFGRTAQVISAPSTYLSNRMVIHLINNYLKYSL